VFEIHATITNHWIYTLKPNPSFSILHHARRRRPYWAASPRHERPPASAAAAPGRRRVLLPQPHCGPHATPPPAASTPWAPLRAAVGPPPLHRSPWGRSSPRRSPGGAELPSAAAVSLAGERRRPQCSPHLDPEGERENEIEEEGSG